MVVGYHCCPVNLQTELTTESRKHRDCRGDCANPAQNATHPAPDLHNSWTEEGTEFGSFSPRQIPVTTAFPCPLSAPRLRNGRPVASARDMFRLSSACRDGAAIAQTSSPCFRVSVVNSLSGMPCPSRFDPVLRAAMHPTLRFPRTVVNNEHGPPPPPYRPR